MPSGKFILTVVAIIVGWTIVDSMIGVTARIRGLLKV
jgi:hypothetical protein